MSLAFYWGALFPFWYKRHSIQNSASTWDLLELLGSDPGAGRDRGSGYTAGHEQDRSGMAA